MNTRREVHGIMIAAAALVCFLLLQTSCTKDETLIPSGPFNFTQIQIGRNISPALTDTLKRDTVNLRFEVNFTLADNETRRRDSLNLYVEYAVSSDSVWFFLDTSNVSPPQNPRRIPFKANAGTVQFAARLTGIPSLYNRLRLFVSVEESRTVNDLALDRLVWRLR